MEGFFIGNYLIAAVFLAEFRRALSDIFLEFDVEVVDIAVTNLFCNAVDLHILL